jgi:hypothetical protein
MIPSRGDTVFLKAIFADKKRTLMLWPHEGFYQPSGIWKKPD